LESSRERAEARIVRVDDGSHVRNEVLVLVKAARSVRSGMGKSA
jgi:hypothetical protein